MANLREEMLLEHIKDRLPCRVKTYKDGIVTITKVRRGNVLTDIIFVRVTKAWVTFWDNINIIEEILEDIDDG